MHPGRDEAVATLGYREAVDRLSVRVLGAFAVDGIDERAIGSRKARLLLKLLACDQGRPVSVDRITDALWPDRAPAKPADQISVLVSRMRSVLGGRITRSDDGYCLRYDWLDLDELLARSRESAARLDADRPGAARAAAAAALQLVSGRLLGDEDGPWADSIRREVHRAVSVARHAGADAALRVDAAADAVALSSAALHDDPYDELALQLLMRAHLQLGRPGSALAAYAEFKERLVDEFGVGPSPRTEEVHDEVVLGKVEAAAGALPSGDSKLLGRAAELELLDGHLAAAGRHSLAVVIEGEPGIGKSALVGEWAARAALAGNDVVLGRCDQLDVGLPLQPVLDALDERLARARDGVEIAAVLAADPDLTGLLGAAGRVRTPSAQTPATTVEDPSTGRRRQFAALTGLVERLRGTGSFVVIIEDVDDADPSTIAWLAFLVRSVPAVLVIVTQRRRGALLDGAAVIALGPLDPGAARELVGEAEAQRLYDRSGGNPLFLLELARVVDGQLPASIVDAVRRRSASLGAAASTIRIAALLGSQLDLDLLASCCRRPVAEVLDHVDVALDHNLLVDDAGGLRFRHDVVRDGLVAGTTESVRAFVHREASSQLSTRRSGNPLDAAHHAELGGDTELAAGALLDGAQIAADRFSLDLADALLGRAIMLADGADARVARARVRLSAGELDGAADDVGVALELDRSPGTLELAGWIDYYRREYPTSLRHAEDARRALMTDELDASVAALEGRIRHARGNLVGAIDCLRPAAAGAVDAGPARRVARVWFAAALTHQGRIADALAALDAAGDPSTLRAHPFATGHAWFVRCLAAGTAGCLSDAFLAAESLQRHVDDAGASGARSLPFALNLRSWLERSVGNLDVAMQLSERALDAAGAASFDEPAAHARLDQVESLLAGGRAAEAGSALGAAVDLFSSTSTMAWHQQQRIMLLSARLALASGEHARAAELAAQLAEDAAARTSERYGVLARHVAMLAAAGSGDLVPPDDVVSLLADLDRLAGLDAWRLTAQLAAGTGIAGLWSEAEARAASLCAQAADVAHLDPVAVERWVASTTENLRRPG